MALRKSQAEVGERLVRIADVLAEVAGVNPSRVFDEEAERVAAQLSPRTPVTRDWSNRPCLSWVDAERMLLRMRRDQAEVERDRRERLAVVEQAAVMAMPAGTIGFSAPGRPDWFAPGHEPERLGPGGRIAEVPG